MFPRGLLINVKALVLARRHLEVLRRELCTIFILSVVSHTSREQVLVELPDLVIDCHGLCFQIGTRVGGEP